MIFSSLSTILTERYPGSTSKVPLDCEISAVELFDPEKPLPPVDCLCVFTAKQLAEIPSMPLNIVCVGSSAAMPEGKLEQSDSNYIVIPDEFATAAVWYILSMFGNTLKQQKLYSDFIYMLLSDGDLASVFSRFAKETDCQMLAVDITGKVLAYSRPFRIDHPHWVHSIEVGYLDKYLIDYILTYRVKHNLSISPQPFVLYCDRLKLYIKTIRVISNGEIIAYAFMGNYTGDFPEFSDRFMTLIAKRMLTTLLGSRSYSIYRFNMHQNILADMINGASEDETIQRISVANLKFPPYMLAAVFKPIYFRESEYLHDVLTPEIAVMFPNAPKLYQKGAIVALLECDKLGGLSESLMAGLREIAAKNSVLIGISNKFCRPERFGVYYQQAEQTVSLAKRQNKSGGVFAYSDYSFYIMLDRIEDKSVLEYTKHPLLSDLEKYDTEKNTDLYETLMNYTMTGFSKNRTAELMFLHRNTVNYRIQQISDIFGADLADSALLFKLQYSFYIDSYLKHRFILPPAAEQ